jgi:hypothetical protein
LVVTRHCCCVWRIPESFPPVSSLTTDLALARSEMCPLIVSGIRVC